MILVRSVRRRIYEVVFANGVGFAVDETTTCFGYSIQELMIGGPTFLRSTMYTFMVIFILFSVLIFYMFFNVILMFGFAHIYCKLFIEAATKMI